MSLLWLPRQRSDIPHIWWIRYTVYLVGFAIKNHLVRQLSELPQGVNEHLMTVQLKLDSNQMASVVSAYAPTLNSQDDVKEAFYASLENILSAIPKEDEIILLGDFNARDYSRKSEMSTPTVYSS